MFIIPILISLKPISDLFSSSYWFSFVIILVMIFVFLWKIKVDYISSYSTIVVEKENLELKGRVESINQLNDHLHDAIHSLPKDFTKYFNESLDFENHSRISVYTFDDKYFKIIARCSHNPTYNQINRYMYPRNEGYIAKCWENNNGKPYFYIDNLPKSNSSYNEKVMKTSEIESDTLENLSMKSRCYYVRMITKDGKFGDPNGVIVLESVNQKFNLEEEEINQIFDTSMILPNLHRIIEINLRFGGNNE